MDGVKCIVLNSQLLKDSSGAGAAGLRAEQWAWLKAELAAPDTAAARHVLAFCHTPPFIFEQDEPTAYFNLDVETRRELLSLFAKHGVAACFCGHYHRNAVGTFTEPRSGNSLDVVTTGAVGTNVFSKGPGSRLEIEGMGTCREVCEDVGGLRLVHVGESKVTHKWHTFAALKGVETLGACGVCDEGPAASSEHQGKKRRA